MHVSLISSERRIQRMELDNDHTPGIYVDYCTATQASWKIWEVDKRDRFKQIFDALRTSTRVKKLLLCCDLLDGLNNYDLYQLASAIEANTSLEILSLQRLVGDTSEGLAAVLRALVNHKPNLRKFSCILRPGFEIIEWSAFIEFIRSNTELEELEFYGNGLTEQQIIEMMDVLQYNTKLKVLHMDGHNDHSFESLKAIAQYVATSTTIEELHVDEDGLTPETTAELISIMQNNKSLISIKPYHGGLNSSDFIKRNLKVYQEDLDGKRKNFKYPPAPEPWQPILLPDTTYEPTIKQLSSEILQLILWQLDVKSLRAFRRTDKQFNKFTKSNNFWRNYYITYFTCVPNDVFLLTDLTYGLKLTRARTHVEAFATPLWEEIFMNSCRARDVAANKYPTDYCIPFMEPVYRQFPPLIGTERGGCDYTALPPDNELRKMKGLPYSSTWFLLYARGTALYHLGFEKLNDGQYNGILFFTQDFSEAFDARFDYMLYIFDWFAAKSEEEFTEKCKKLCQVYLAALTTNNYNVIAAPFYKQVYDVLLKPALESRDMLISEMNMSMDSAAKDFCNKCQSVNWTLIEDLTKKIKNFTEIPNLEIERVRQYIPKRSTLNSTYGLENRVNFYHSFTQHNWDEPKDESMQYEAPKHRKKSKNLPLVAIMKLYRVTLNLILMPVLKTFWLDDIKSPDYELHPFVRWQTVTLDTYKKLYYSTPYVPFKHVSISKAHPSQWPMIALGLAHQLLPFITAAINGLVSGTEDGLKKLIEVLDQASILVPQRVKSFLHQLSASQRQ